MEKAVELALIERSIHRFSGQLKWVKIDTYRNVRVAQRYGVVKNPSILFFQNGQVAAALEDDAITEDALAQAIAQLLQGKA